MNCYLTKCVIFCIVVATFKVSLSHMFVIGVSTHIIAFYSLIIITLILATNNMKALGQAPILFYENSSMLNILSIKKQFISFLRTTFLGLLPIKIFYIKKESYFEIAQHRKTVVYYSSDKPLRAPPYYF